MAKHTGDTNYTDNPAKMVDLGAPNLVDNNTYEYMGLEDAAWGVGVNPVGKFSITNAIGNGQLGVGIKAPALDVATPLILPPAVIVVLQIPSMYDNVAAGDGHGGQRLTAMGAAIKDIFESHAKAVTGIDIDYTLESVGDQPLHDGQNFQAPGKTKRTQQSPSFTFGEVTGNLYWNIMKKWITDINYPDTYAIGANVHVSGGWTMSAYSMTIAVIQPDVTGRPDRIIDCSIFCNMFPQGTGGLGVERNIGQMKSGNDRSVTFTAIQQHNAYTKQLGQLIMEKLSMHKLDFDWAPPQRDIWTKSLDAVGLGKDVEIRGDFYPRGKADGEYNVEEDIANNLTKYGNDHEIGITDRFTDADRL
jgi:hypothetical protein